MVTTATHINGDRVLTSLSATQVIAERLEAARKSADIPVLRLSEAAGIPRTTLTRKLAGKGDWTIPELQAVTSQIGVTLSDIVRDLPRAA